jgi:hypothetical protein
MQIRPYFLVTSCLFSLVAIAHLARVIGGWPIQVAQWSIPLEASWIGLAVTALLAIWGFSLARGHGNSDQVP